MTRNQLTQLLPFAQARLQTILTFALVCFSTLSSFGWGRTGHHIIADLAQGIAKPATIDSVTLYLPDQTWHAASTWMDELRDLEEFDYMRPWHFINLEEGQTYCPSIAEGNNVIHQLEVAISNLKNRRNLTPDQIAFNLRVLFHLMGDLHNPLHVGYGKDRGGNDVRVVFNDRTISLHRFWDTPIVESQQNTRSNVMARLQQTRKRRLNRLAKGSPQTWYLDARAALPMVYSLPSDTITTQYLQKGYPIAENLLFLSGVRLGVTLNNIFSRY